MKKYIIIGLLVAVAIIGWVLLSGKPAQKPGGEKLAIPIGPELEPRKPLATNQGVAVFGITDELVSLGNIQAVVMTVKELMVHSPSKGWVSVSKTPRTYDLFYLHSVNATEFLADANLEAGSYDQIRLIIDKIVVTPNGGAPQEAKLPSNDLRLVGELLVEKGKTASAVFDFLSEKSLHITGDGKYIFAPVIKLDTRNDVEVAQISKRNEQFPNGRLDVGGGRPKFSGTLGMDENGNFKTNGGIDPLSKVELINGYIKVIPRKPY